MEPSEKAALDALHKWEKGEESARHGLFIFLLLYVLIGIDTMSKTGEEQKRAMKAWTTWGVTFILLAFFFITPEQEQLQKQAEAKAKRPADPV